MYQIEERIFDSSKKCNTTHQWLSGIRELILSIKIKE